MYNDDFATLAGAVAGTFFGFLLGLFVFAADKPTDSQAFETICVYEGGEVQGDVCIKDGSVITIDLPGDN